MVSFRGNGSVPGVRMVGPRHVEDETGSRRIGLRRVDWIRVLLGTDGPRAEAVGIRHRMPVAVPITLAAATRIVADGAPLVVRDLRVRDLRVEV